MFTKEQIRDFFQKMGLRSEEERARFSNIGKVSHKLSKPTSEVSTRGAIDTRGKEAAEDAELA